MAVEITEMISQLPMLFEYMQTFSYIILILFFGATAIKGWRGFLPWFYKWPLRILVGSVCLLASFSIADYIPTLSTGIFRLFQSHIIAAGIVAAIIMSIALYLISFKLPAVLESYKREIIRLQNKLSKMKKAKPNKIFTAAGIVIIAGLLLVTAVTWKGFPPNMGEDIFSSLIPEGELPGGITLGPGMSKLNPDCLSIITVMSTAVSQDPEVFSNLQPFENAELKATIESQSGIGIIEMYMVEYEGQRIVLTIMEDGKRCVSSEEEFCACSEEQ